MRAYPYIVVAKTILVPLNFDSMILFNQQLNHFTLVLPQTLLPIFPWVLEYHLYLELI